MESGWVVEWQPGAVGGESRVEPCAGDECSPEGARWGRPQGVRVEWAHLAIDAVMLGDAAPRGPDRAEGQRLVHDQAVAKPLLTPNTPQKEKARRCQGRDTATNLQRGCE